MSRLMRLSAALVWAISVAPAALAQGADGAGLSPSQTARVVEVLDAGFATCLQVDPVYRIDCFGQVYRNGSKILGKNASYWEAEVALTRVGRNLYSFVRANADPGADRIRYEGFRLKAIRKDAMPEAEALYQQNVARAAALLRDGNGAERRFFGPIADEVDQYRELVP